MADAPRLDMSHTRLGGEDGAWLHMEDATNPMVINGLLELAAPLDPARLTVALRERVMHLDRFRMCVTERLGGTRWDFDPQFDVARHVEHVQLEPSLDDAALRTFIGAKVSALLPRDRPLWRVYVVDRPGAGSVLLYRVHHAIADGFALLGVLLSLCENAGSLHTPTSHAVPQVVPGVVDHALALTRIALLPADPHTALKGPLTTEKRVAWSEPLSLDRVKATAKACDATVNDVLVATATGALRRYLARRGDDVAHLEVRAMLPVNLRRDVATDTLGNHFGLFVLSLPVSGADAGGRVAEVKRRMNALKSSPEAFVTHGILRTMGWAPRFVEDLGVTFFGKKASLVLTNVPGPRERLVLCGVPVTRLMFWVPQSGRMGLGISIFSYAGEVTLGVIADAGLLPDPERFAADLHVELAAIEAFARTGEAHAVPIPRRADPTYVTTASNPRTP
jgi:diacylglycerol O-acyltransferase / wax synthase